MLQVGDFMSAKGIVFLAFALIGAILNYGARPLGEKMKVSPLKLKVAGLIIVLISVSLIFIFGK